MVYLSWYFLIDRDEKYILSDITLSVAIISGIVTTAVGWELDNRVCVINSSLNSVFGCYEAAISIRVFNHTALFTFFCSHGIITVVIHLIFFFLLVLKKEEVRREMLQPV